MHAHPDLSRLTHDEVEAVTRALQGLVSSLKARMGIGAGNTGLVKDEEIVLQSLLHPERGDVLVSVVKDHHDLHLFVSNRRDSGSPFVVMNAREMRRHPARRPVDTMHTPRDEQYGLFLSSQQDRDMIQRHEQDRADIYSIHFGIAEARVLPEIKKPHEFGILEKMEFVKKAEHGDPTAQTYIKELFTFPVTFSKYKGSPREVPITLPPDKEMLYIGQMVRDIYPYNIRVILRKEDPQTHNSHIAEAQAALSKLRDKIQEKKSEAHPENYSAYLNRLTELIDNALKSDPELAKFI
jgi:hypothetical protein